MAHTRPLSYPISVSDTTNRSQLSPTQFVLGNLSNTPFLFAMINGLELALKLKSNCLPELDGGEGNRFQRGANSQLVVAS